MTNLAHDYSWLPEPPPRTFRLMKGERAAMYAAPDESAAEWAQGERMVHVTPLPGTWDNDTVPYAKSIMELLSAEHVREAYLAGGSQTAKTDLTHNLWGWFATHDPGPAMLVMQDRDTGTETIHDRLIPMIMDTRSLRRLMTNNPDDISLKRIRLRNGMVTYLAWGKSEGRVASKPIRILIMSEVDLYPPRTIKKARARTGAFEGMQKIVEECTVSTEDGRIWSTQHLAQARFDYWAKCPHCNELQVMDPSRVQWTDGIVEPSGLIRNEDAWYLCAANGCKWDDHDRDEAVRNSELRARDDGSITDKPESVWIHISPLLSPFVKFRRVAKAYLATLTEPTEENLVYYYNDCCGLPTPNDIDGDQPQEKDLYERRYDYAPEGATWRIPMAGVSLTGDTDVQDNRLELEVVAWGEGHQSWGVEYKVFHGDPRLDDVWDQLHDYLEEQAEFEHESGVILRPSIIGVDCGFLPDQVGKFIKRSPRYRAHKGSNQPGRPLIPKRASKSSKYKFKFYELGVDTGKDLLFGWLGVVKEGKRHCHFPKSYDFEYFRMLCAEEKKRKRNKETGRLEIKWGLRKGFTRNESLDIRVGNMAMRAIANPNYKALAQRIGRAVEAGELTVRRKRKVKVKRPSNKFTDKFKG